MILHVQIKLKIIWRITIKLAPVAVINLCMCEKVHV